MRHLIGRSLTVIGAVTVLVQATGNYVLLGGDNTSKTTTALSKDSGRPPLALLSRNAYPPLIVNSEVKVSHLHADLVDALDATDLRNAKTLQGRAASDFDDAKTLQGRTAADLDDAETLQGHSAEELSTPFVATSLSSDTPATTFVAPVAPAESTGGTFYLQYAVLLEGASGTTSFTAQGYALNYS